MADATTMLTPLLTHYAQSRGAKCSIHIINWKMVFAVFLDSLDGIKA